VSATPPADAVRARPAHKPRDVRCPTCNAGLPVQDEHARTVACAYCGTIQKLGEVEARVLGRGPKKKPKFQLRLGDRLQFDGGRYEVVARLLFEEEDEGKTTEEREYLLYSPRRGTLYLDEYEGDWKLLKVWHSQPENQHAYAMDEGASLRTGDGSSWTCEESGEYLLRYVDGSLPWVASVGNRVKYASFRGAGGAVLEVERSGKEIEVARGRKLTVDDVKAAIVSRSASSPGAEKDQALAAANRARDDAKQRASRIVRAVALVCIALNLVGALVTWFRGTNVGRASVPLEKLEGETLVGPWDLPVGLARFDVEAPNLKDEWEAVDLALVEGDDRVVDVMDADLDYYSGYEDGENWSEGSGKESVYVLVPRAGAWRLLVHATGGRGESEQATGAPASLEIGVFTGVSLSGPFVFAGVFCMIVWVLAGAVGRSRRVLEEL